MNKKTLGFTLVEIIMASALFALVAAGVTAFAVFYFRNYSFSFEENQSIGLAQSSVTTLIREIREARSGEDGSWPIAQADDNTFIFYSDITNDGRSDRVRYFIENGELKKGVIEPTVTLINYPTTSEQIKIVSSNVDNGIQPLFQYYNGNWPGDTTNNPLIQGARLLNTRYVSVYVRININSDTGVQPFELKSGVQLRSLKDNL